MIRLFSTIFGLSLIGVSFVLTAFRRSDPLYFIAFLSNRDGNAEIFRMSPDGEKLTQLTHTTPLPNDSHGYCGLEWLPNGFDLITSYGTNYEPGDFFCYHNYGVELRLNTINERITPFDYEKNPLAWSPDAQSKLFIEPVRAMGQVIYEMYQVETKSMKRQVIAEVTNWRGTPVEWSDDWIIYMDDPNADYRNEIYRLHSNGTAIQRLIPPSNNTIFCDQLAISGNWLISVVQDSDGNCNQIYRTPLNERQFVLESAFLTKLPTTIDYTTGLIPSPDGKWAAFWDTTYTIHVLDADTGTVHRVTQPLIYPTMLSLDWSPDSQWMIFTSCDVFCKIHRIRPDGTDEQPLTSGEGDDVFAAYSSAIHFSWRFGILPGLGVLFLLPAILLKFLKS